MQISKKILFPFLTICFLGFIGFLFSVCLTDNRSKSRETAVNKGNQKIVFGMSYPIAVTESTTGFVNGIGMAVAEINRAGGVLGKQIGILKQDDEGSVTTGSEIAQSFVDNPKISAVIGHWNSRVSNAVADIYNRNGMVMITPASTSPFLTQQGYKYIFRKINNDLDYGGVMARYAAATGLDKVVVYYADDDYGRGLANAFEDVAYQHGVQVVDRTTGINERNIGNLLDKWRAFDYNAIFVADVMPAAGDVIKAIRAAGIQMPILGATGIDRDSFIKTMGPDSEGISLPTEFNPHLPTVVMTKFIRNYEKLYGCPPDTWAAQGYETVKLLCSAIEAAGSALPEKIAEALYKIRNYQGIFGRLSCDSTGEIVGKAIYVKTVKSGKYVYLGKY